MTPLFYNYGIYKHLKTKVIGYIQNKIQYLLSKGYKNNWVKYNYFEDCNPSEISEIIFSNFVQTNTIIFLCFCFNKEINLRVKYQ